MSTTPDTINFLHDQLRSIEGRIRTRKMFGEYALYCDEKVVALVCNDTLYVKITPIGKELVGEEYVEGAPYPGAKPHIKIVGDILENPTALSTLIVSTAQALPLKIKK